MINFSKQINSPPGLYTPFFTAFQRVYFLHNFSVRIREVYWTTIAEIASYDLLNILKMYISINFSS